MGFSALSLVHTYNNFIQIFLQASFIIVPKEGVPLTYEKMNEM